MNKYLRSFRHNDSGSVALITAIGLFTFLGFVALALDISHIISVKSELQRAADASALAGVRGLYPDTVNTVSNASYPLCGQAQERALRALQGNIVDGMVPSTNDSTVETGSWNYATKQFSPSCNLNTNTMQVMVRRNGVNMLFARIFGINTMNESASSTAVMDWVKSVGPGTLPIAINEDYAKSGNLEKVTFNPSTSDVGGWFSVPPDSASASTLDAYVNAGSCPAIKVGDLINLNNGVITSVMQSLKDKLAERDGTWDVTLPLVDSTQFNEVKPVKGFVVFRITTVSATGGDKYVQGVPLALGMGPGGSTPGGANYGVLAPPRLVK